MPRPDSRRGKTWEEIYGPEVAAQKRLLGKEIGSRRTGKTYEEIYGPDRAAEQRRIRSLGNIEFGPRSWSKFHVSIPKGTTYEEWYGEKAQEEIDKRTGRRVGVGRFHSDNYKEWRVKVLERDKYSCLDCGTINTSNDVHHTIPWKESESLRFEVSNGETLCRSCHGRREVH